MQEVKEVHPGWSLARMCRLFGITRQAYYKHCRSRDRKDKSSTIVVDMVKEIRGTHPRIGGKKLYHMLQERLCQHHIKLGRDAMFDLLRQEGLLMRKRRRRAAITTWSGHPYRKYPNLIKGLQVDAPNKIWVSDITYLKTKSGFVYISLITDVYSSKIVGYDLAANLEAVNSLNALRMAITENIGTLDGLIHHSDRGLQYCSHEYIKLLNTRGIRISMTQSGDPLENAKAERINGIIKNEYLNTQTITGLQHAKQMLPVAIIAYNQGRPHLSCNMLTPQQIHEHGLKPKKLWKNYYRKNSNIVTLLQD